MFTARELFERRRSRNRAAIRRVSSGQPRLSVHRSSKHMYAQIIDDTSGRTLAAASTSKPRSSPRVAPATAPLLQLLESLLPSARRPTALKPSSLTAVVTSITVV